jgi:hypothetical protein
MLLTSGVKVYTELQGTPSSRMTIFLKEVINIQVKEFFPIHTVAGKNT